MYPVTSLGDTCFCRLQSIVKGGLSATKTYKKVVTFS